MTPPNLQKMVARSRIDCINSLKTSGPALGDSERRAHMYNASPPAGVTDAGFREAIELTAKKLASDTRLPIVWEEQRARIGIIKKPSPPSAAF